MAITAYVGLPGTGKSYGVVANVILPALHQGRSVITNIPLQSLPPEEQLLVTQFDKDQFSDDLLAAEHWGSIYVIDEPWRYWPTGLKADKIPEHIRSFFAEHRHRVSQESGLATEITLVTQDLGQICNFVRSLVSETYHHTKLTAVGATRKCRVDVYQGCVTGPAPPKAKVVSSYYDTYKPEIYKFYKSHTLSDVAGKELATDKRGNIFKGAQFKLLAFAAVFLIFAVMYFGYNTYSRLSEKRLAKTEENQGHVSPPEPAPVHTASSLGYEMAGVIGQYLILQNATNYKVVHAQCDSLGVCLYEDRVYRLELAGKIRPAAERSESVGLMLPASLDKN